MRHDAHFVDQLVRADEIPIGRRIPIDRLEANPDQPRSVLGDLEGLRASIAEKGILEPILVRPRSDGRFTIIAGERRFRAALEAGLEEVPCIEMTVSDQELLEIALVENLQRRDLTPLEEADGFGALQEKHGYTHEEIASAVGKSRVTVTETLSLNRLPESVKDRCRRADITSKSLLLELSRLASEDDMIAALDAHASGAQVTRDEVRERRAAERDGAKRAPSREAFSFDYVPQDRRYKVSLVLRGRMREKDEILDAIRDLARRIESGEIDLAAGRFASAKKPKPAPTKTRRTT
jgi:ParB family transcriptional regulator, chromosome partitioning protein